LVSQLKKIHRSKKRELLDCPQRSVARNMLNGGARMTQGCPTQRAQMKWEVKREKKIEKESGMKSRER
jgi:hypothetical protein